MDFQSQLIILLLFVTVVITALWLFVYPGYRRRRLDRQPFPRDWEHIVRRSLPFYDGMPAEQQRELKNLIKRFLDDKTFVPCAGQSVDDEVRVSIAAQACLLLLNRPTSEYGQLRHILVYPGHFRVNRPYHDEAGLVSQDHSVLAGESWDNGRLVLAWDSVEEGARDFSDGYNVVLHEFAHQLDQENGVANGSPLLQSTGGYASWAKVFSDEFEHLQQAVDSQQNSVFDYYGATHPAEFFAVATETFYEKPDEMAERHPELFGQLRDYYRVDPREWHRQDY